MNVNFIKRNQYPVLERDVKILSEKTGLHEKLVELFFSRGINTEEAINKFLNPDKSNFYDPMLLKGMEEAKERLEHAIENGENVVVYGDYDVDGVCASAILSLYLSSRGLNIYTHIPNRMSDGYGLNTESLSKIIESACPDLILTCDCGISGHKEIEFAMDLGVDVIVTDHHEIAGPTPDCIVVNPKQEGCPYPFKNLCGAGVALKLVEALGGREAADDFLDLAAIATVADLMPLLDENRLIVQLGLKCVKNIGLKNLLKNQQIDLSRLSSGDIAYKIAPRINAAGRMGDAYRAFELLITKDIVKIENIVNQINEENDKRKTLCDEAYAEALTLLNQEKLSKERAVIISHPAWEKGITGILAAKLAGEFRRPSFVLVNSCDQLKGTARSISGINLYDVLTKVGGVLTEFGGHNQAAGFSLKKENLDEFKSLINEELKEYPDSLFLPYCEYDAEIELSQIDTVLAKALEKMEPIGNSNSRPLFKTTVKKLEISPCKSNPNHTNIITQNKLMIIAFNFYNENQFLLGENEKEILIEVQLNNFSGKESVKTILRAVKPSSLYFTEAAARAGFIKNLAYLKNAEQIFTAYEPEELDNLINGGYGCLVVAGREKSLEILSDYAKDKLILNEFMFPSTRNNYSRLMVSPDFDDESLMLPVYDTIIFLDSPVGEGLISFLNSKTNAKIYIPSKSNENEFLFGIDLSRETFGKYFEVLKRNSDITAQNIFSFYRQLSARVRDLNLTQFIVCFAVFNELNFFSVKKEQFALIFNPNLKSGLDNSSIYSYLKEKL